MARGKFVVALAALVASAAVSAAATQLGGLGSSSLGADAAPVTACTSAGVTTVFVLDGMLVTGVSVDGLPVECLGKTVFVTVSPATGPGGESSGVVAAASTTLTLDTPVPANLVELVAVVVAG